MKLSKEAKELLKTETLDNLVFYTEELKSIAKNKHLPKGVKEVIKGVFAFKVRIYKEILKAIE